MSFKRVISSILVICMLATVFPLAVFAKQEEEGPAVWEAKRMEKLTVEQMGEGVIYAGTLGGSAEERGKYVITLFRDGYSENEASIELHTIDVSAKIGVDYDIIGEETTYTDLGGTVMERNANYDANESIENFNNSIEELKAIEEENEEESESPEVKEKSSLARIKEEKTGIETRDIIKNDTKKNTNLAESVVKMVTPEQQEMSEYLNQYTKDNMGEYVEGSSVTLVTFAPGETYKEITVEVYEDEEAEGDEAAYFLLSGVNGAMMGGEPTVSINILDDEESEDAYLSLSDDFYRFDEGEDNIVIVRTGALYKMATADVRLEDGSVQTVTFKPFDTEKKIALTATGSGIMDVKLENFKGCCEGEITEASVVYGEEKEFELLSEIDGGNEIATDFDLMADVRTSNCSFILKTIKGHNGANLRVDYVANQKDEDGHLYGKIMDTGRNPEAYIGNYYFPQSFSYGMYTGHDDPNKKESYHGYNSENNTESITDEPGGYARLYWYDAITGKKGSSYTRLSNINHGLYKYYAGDIYQNSGDYGHVYFKVFRNNGDEFKTKKGGEFDRCLSMQHTSLLREREYLDEDKKEYIDHYLPQADGGYLEIHAADEEKNRTPHTGVYAYGIAAFFREFEVSINQPGKMNFLNSDGSYSSVPPVVVNTGEGHGLRYTEQSLSIVQSPAFSNGIIPVELIAYKVETNPMDNTNKKEFYYIAPGKSVSDISGYKSGDIYYNAPSGTDMENIHFNEDFIVNKIDKNLTKVSGSGIDWSTEVRFTPIYKKRPATVQFIDGDNGKLKNIFAGTYSTKYYLGDTIGLTGEPEEGYYFAGYRVIGRATSNLNETPLIDRTEWSQGGNSLSLLLGESNCTHYQIQPVFQKLTGNYITLDVKSGAKVRLKNILSAGELDILIKNYPNNGFKKDQKILVVNPSVKNSTDAKSILDSITVKAGEIYKIEADEYLEGATHHRPTFYNKYFSEKTITSNVFYYVASSDLLKNKIEVGSVKRYYEEEPRMKIMGKISTADFVIRQSATNRENVGVENLSVLAGDKGYYYNWVTVKENGNDVSKKLKLLAEASAVTDENGNFEISGISAMPDDVITMYFNGGENKGVRIIDFSELVNDKGESVKEEDEITYSIIVTDDENNVNSEDFKTENGFTYDLNKVSSEYYSLITTPVYPTGSPTIESVDYTYFNGSNIETFGITKNNIAIIDDKLYITVKIDRNGHQLSNVEFFVDKKYSKDASYFVKGEKDKDVYTCDFSGYSMKDIFEPGDRIYIRLHDAQTRKITTTTYDDNDKEIVVETEEPIVYNKLYTGLSMYVPMLDAVVQVLEFPDSAAVEAPVVGHIMGSSTSGMLTFSVKDWKNADGGIDGISVILDANIAAWEHNAQTNPGRKILEKVKEDRTTGKNEAAQIHDPTDPLNLEDYKNAARSNWKNSLNDTFRKPIVKINAVFLMQLEFAFKDGDYFFVGGQIAVGASASVKGSLYWMLSGVPIYLMLSGDFAVQMQANFGYSENTLSYNEFKQYENVYDALSFEGSDLGIFIQICGHLSVGVGVCGVLGARGIFDADLLIYTSFFHITDNSGIMARILGGVAIDLVLCSLQYQAGYQMGSGIYEDETGWLASDEEDIQFKGVSIHKSGDGSQVGDEIIVEENYDILIDNSAERVKPNVITLNDGRKLLVYIGSDINRQVEVNRNCLYYSIYEDGQWQPAQIIENDGTADAAPTVEKYGDMVIIAWTDAKRAFEQEEIAQENYKEILSEFDISAIVFNSADSTFGEVITISNDEEVYGGKYLDYMPVISADSKGEQGAAFFYIKREILDSENHEEMADVTSVYETIALTVMNNNREVLAEQFIPIEGDPLMFNLDSAMMPIVIDGEEHVFAICTYLTDKDGEISDNSDWDAYLLFHDVTANKTFEPINLCNDFIPDVEPKFTRVDDNVYLTFVSYSPAVSTGKNESVLNYINITEYIDALQHGSESEEGTREWNIDMGDLFFDENPDDDIPWYKKTATDLGITEEQYETSLYVDLFNSDIPFNHVSMNKNENEPSSLGSYQIVKGDDGRIYVLWLDNGSTAQDDYSVELYGAVHSEDREVGERAGWSKPVKLTNFSDVVDNTVIDEFTVAVDENGEFTLVSNMYTQNLVKSEVEYSPNKLVAFTLDESGEIKIEDNATFDVAYPTAGNETELTFNVNNDGLQEINVTKAVVSVDGCEDVEIDINKTLFGGESSEVKATLMMPESIDENTTVTITVETEDGQTAVSEIPVPYGANLVFVSKKILVHEDGALEYVAEISNVGNKPSGEFNLDVQQIKNGEGLIGQVSQQPVDSIDADETCQVSVTLDEKTLTEADFENGFAELKVTANQSGTELASAIKRVGSNLLNPVEEDKDEETEEDDSTPSRRPTGSSGGGSLAAKPDETPDEKPEVLPMPFTDVEVEAWYYDSVKNVYDKGLFKGTSETTFEPDSPITRGMFVTVLHRVEGEPDVAGEIPFDDVSGDSYFANAVVWAAENGIITGYDENTFGPEDLITREQIAAIMYRYANYKEADTTVGENTNILSFEDYAEISEYAIPAVQYAVGSGLMKGKSDSTFNPQDNSTRAEMATVMTRLSF